MTGSTFQLRRLVPDDADEFVRVRREALDREPFAFASSPSDDKGLSTTFVRDALAATDQATFGAFASELIGVVGIYRDFKAKSAHKAHLWGLYVSAKYRGTGVGRALALAALDFARGLDGVSQMHLGVSERHLPALHLYEQLGFETWGTEPTALRVDGESVAEHHMVLQLK